MSSKLVFSQAIHDAMVNHVPEGMDPDSEDVFDALDGAADGSCKTDGETDAESIFENGFELAVKAQARGLDVFQASGNGSTTFFFIGDNEAAVVAKIRGALESLG